MKFQKVGKCSPVISVIMLVKLPNVQPIIRKYLSSIDATMQVVMWFLVITRNC